MHSCHTGDEDMLGVFFNSIRVLPSNRTAQETLSQWWNSTVAAGVADVDLPPPLWESPCLWNTTFAEVRVYAHNCNPSCPNIAYLAENQQRQRSATDREE